MDLFNATQTTVLPRPLVAQAAPAATPAPDRPARELTTSDLLTLMEDDPYFARLFGLGGC